jgi:lysophospholipase L1-like esterase
MIRLFPQLVLAVLCAGFPGAAETAPNTFGNHVVARGAFQNARIRFEREQRGTVAFLGGSITEMNGYRPMVCSILTNRFPRTAFTFIQAGISSTCSTTGAFRFGTDVLSQGRVDLLFIEFAVNDDQDAHHDRNACIRGMEGIVRQARRANPEMDIVITFFVNEFILKTLQAGRTPLTIEAHEAVAAHYAIPTIHLAGEVAKRVTAGSLTWKQFGGVHPAPLGNALCASMIRELMDRAWSRPLTPESATVPAPMPPTPLDPLSYANGRFLDPAAARFGQGWTLGIPDWQSLPGTKRPRFSAIPMLCATEPGSELTLAFEGTAIGAYLVAGPDAGTVAVRIDGKPFPDVNLDHAYSKGLHYPRTVMFGTGLDAGPHTLSLRIAPTTSSTGHAMRIMRFAAN